MELILEVSGSLCDEAARNRKALEDVFNQKQEGHSYFIQTQRDMDLVKRGKGTNRDRQITIDSKRERWKKKRVIDKVEEESAAAGLMQRKITIVVERESESEMDRQKKKSYDFKVEEKQAWGLRQRYKPAVGGEETIQCNSKNQLLKPPKVAHKRVKEG